MQAIGHWTEDELSREIARLDDMINRKSLGADERSRCVTSYLRQVRQDRRDALAVLKIRHRRTH